VPVAQEFFARIQHSLNDAKGNLQKAQQKQKTKTLISSEEIIPSRSAVMVTLNRAPFKITKRNGQNNFSLELPPLGNSQFISCQQIK